MAEVKKRVSLAFFAESAVCHEQTAKRFFRLFGKKQAVFAHKIGSCSPLYMARWQGKVAMNARAQIRPL